MKLNGETLEYVAMHVSGIELADGNRYVRVTVKDAPDAVVVSNLLADIYQPIRIEGNEGESKTFTMEFQNPMQGIDAYADIKDAVDLYSQLAAAASSANIHSGSSGNGSSGHGYTHTPAATQSKTTAPADYTNIVVCAVAVVAIILLWPTERS